MSSSSVPYVSSAYRLRFAGGTSDKSSGWLCGSATAELAGGGSNVPVSLSRYGLTSWSQMLRKSALVLTALNFLENSDLSQVKLESESAVAFSCSMSLNCTCIGHAI